jgi:hypothetical protein
MREASQSPRRVSNRRPSDYEAGVLIATYCIVYGELQGIWEGVAYVLLLPQTAGSEEKRGMP